MYLVFGRMKTPVKFLQMTSLHCTHTCTEKLVFFDVIIEDDPGETEMDEEVIPYQLSTEAMAMDMKVQDIKVTYMYDDSSHIYFLLGEIGAGVYRWDLHVFNICP